MHSRARAHPDTFQNNIQPTPTRARVSPRSTCARAWSVFSRHRRGPLSVSVSRYRLPLPLSVPPTVSISLFLPLPLSPPSIFVSSSQRRFFRTHTPPRINNSPYEFTRKRASERTGESGRRDERADGLADKRLGGEQHAFLSRHDAAPRSRAETTRKRARSPHHRDEPREESHPNLHVWVASLSAPGRSVGRIGSDQSGSRCVALRCAALRRAAPRCAALVRAIRNGSVFPVAHSWHDDDPRTRKRATTRDRTARTRGCST